MGGWIQLDVLTRRAGAHVLLYSGRRAGSAVHAARQGENLFTAELPAQRRRTLMQQLRRFPEPGPGCGPRSVTGDAPELWRGDEQGVARADDTHDSDVGLGRCDATGPGTGTRHVSICFYATDRKRRRPGRARAPRSCGAWSGNAGPTPGAAGTPSTSPGRAAMSLGARPSAGPGRPGRTGPECAGAASRPRPRRARPDPAPALNGFLPSSRAPAPPRRPRSKFRAEGLSGPAALQGSAASPGHRAVSRPSTLNPSGRFPPSRVDSPPIHCSPAPPSPVFPP